MADQSPAPAAARPESTRSGYEVTDASAPGILGAGVGLLLIGLAIFFVSWRLFDVFKDEVRRGQVPRTVFTRETQIPPEPRLQLSPQQDLSEFRQKTRETLTRFRWLDRKEGWVQIPLDDAMELLAADQGKRSRRK